MKLPSLKFVCAMIQGEEIRRKVISRDTNSRATDTHVYNAKTMSRSENSSMFDYHSLSRQAIYERTFKGKQSDLKCSYCHNTGHLIDRCWQLHPEIKP